MRIQPWASKGKVVPLYQRSFSQFILKDMEAVNRCRYKRYGGLDILCNVQISINQWVCRRTAAVLPEQMGNGKHAYCF